MASLYELEQEIAQLLDLLEDPESDETQVQQELDALSIQIESKFDSYMKVRAQLLADAEVLKNEESRLKERKVKLQKRAENLSKSVQSAMQTIGKTKIEGTLFSAKLCATPGILIIDDEEEVPESFIKTETTTSLDKAAIKEFLKENPDCEWAHIQKGYSLRIS